MQLKKSWFGHINFAIGTLIMSVYLYTLFVSLIADIEKSYGVSIKVFGIPVRMVGGILLFLLAVIFFILISFIKSHFISTKVIFKNSINNLIFWTLTVLLFAFNVYKRIVLLLSFTKKTALWNMTKWQSVIGIFDGKEYQADNLIEKLYVLFLQFLLKVFGPLENVAVYLNLALCLSAFIFVFFTVKFVFGRIPAFFSCLLITFVNRPYEYLFDLSGINLWIFMVSFVAFVITYFFDLFLDKYTFLCIGFFTVFIAAGMLLNQIFYLKFNFYFYKINDVFSYMLTEYTWLSVLLGFLAFLGFLSYIKAKDDFVSYANILLLIFLFIYLFDFSHNMTYLYLDLIIGVLAGIGYRWLVFEGLKDYVFSVDDLTQEEEMPKNIVTTEEVKVKEQEEEILEEVNMGSENLVISEEDYDDSKEKPKFLHNPLPVPKKHVKKTMDYAFVPDEEMMDFDIEVSENDDFDIN